MQPSELATATPSWSDFISSRAPASPSRLTFRRDGWRTWITLLIPIAVICAVATQMNHLNLSKVLSVVPSSPLFWLTYVAWYLAGPVSDWLIFRRLWQLPIAGFPALVAKLVSNELLVGYIGEAYFYGWARSRAGLTGSPFGAIKDVAILSALIGNITTLVMMLVTWPLFSILQFGVGGSVLLISVGVVILTSSLMMLLRRRLFSLPAAELRFIALNQLARIIVMTLLAASLWHMALPAVGWSWWLLLATIRLLISRLPFVPGKDLVFAGIAIFLVGRDAEISNILAMLGGLTLAVHLVLGGALAARDLIGLGLKGA